MNFSVNPELSERNFFSPSNLLLIISYHKAHKVNIIKEKKLREVKNLLYIVYDVNRALLGEFKLLFYHFTLPCILPELLLD